MPAPQRAAAGAASPRAPSPGAGARRAQVLATLRERIARQQIPPGAKLREHELALEFGVPRSQIREAFSALEQRGLIERIPNRGAIVARLDPEQLFQIYDLREVLEGLCARLATQNAAPESWQDLVELFDGPMQQYVEQGDFERFLAGYERFRRRTIEAAAHPLLAQMLDSIYEKTQVLIRRTIILPGRAKVGLSEHRAVLAAMRRGDADAAERLRRENMRSARECLRRYQSYIL
ncbi:MAG TPA: GntR family transcriptional regulator [Burkholderiaceae bacterium]|nr:GntR family transcriptional regulator [Burkholderiaceae bacterium]